MQQEVADLPCLSRAGLERIYRTLILSPQPRRDRALLTWMLSLGSTPRQVVRLATADVDLERGHLRWNDARHANQTGLDGYTPYEVQLPQELLHDLRDYFLRERVARTDRMFVTRLGHPTTTLAVQHLFTWIQRQTGYAWLTPQYLRERRRAYAMKWVSPVQLMQMGEPWVYRVPAAPLHDAQTASSGSNLR